MSLTFKLGDVVCGPLTSATGNTCAKDFQVGSAKTDLIRWHQRGTTGNLLGIGATEQRAIKAVVRYTAANPTELYAAHEANIALWENPSSGIIVTSNSGTAYQRCRLQDEGATIVRPPQTLGPGKGCFMDCQYIFICDAG